MNIAHTVIFYGISLIILAMLIRAICSWFGIGDRYAFIRLLARITDPFIAPVRRIVKPVGVIDLSFLITWFLLITIQTLLLQALPSGW